MRVNLDATRNLLERCRAPATRRRSSCSRARSPFSAAACPIRCPTTRRVTPQSSYGTQKAIGELLVNDMSRKGFIDGRSLRLPTIVVRPGKPNRAASSFASGIIREPLSGVDAICPVAPTTRMWVQSPRAVVDNLLVGHEAPAASFPRFAPINVPGMCVAVGDMVSALRSVAGDAVAARVQWQYDPGDRSHRLDVAGALRCAQAGRALGMRADDDFESVVRDLHRTRSGR